MGPAAGLRATLWRLCEALRPMRQRGFGWAMALGVQLPVALAWRAWRRLARPVNGRWLGRWLNGPALADFQDGLAPATEMRWYVIVMPRVLHFLLPCLALLRGRVPLVLIANGAREWELELLRRRLPEAPLFRLRHLPGTSVEHGDVITLLLEHHRGPFGLVDHDCYLFEPGLLATMRPGAGECMVALFADRHPHLGFELPLTHLLALNAEPLRALMHEFGVGASMARRAPASVRPALDRLGLRPGHFFKPYHRFFDTLHLLLALALDRGWRVRVPQSHAERPVVHIGGTSIGSHHTKNLFALYVHLRFLELLGDAAVQRRYAHLTHPLRTPAQALERRLPGDRGWEGQALLEQTLPRLREALDRAWPPFQPVNGASPS